MISARMNEICVALTDSPRNLVNFDLLLPPPHLECLRSTTGTREGGEGDIEIGKRQNNARVVHRRKDGKERRMREIVNTGKGKGDDMGGGGGTIYNILTVRLSRNSCIIRVLSL